MLLTAICEHAYSVIYIQNVDLKPSPSTQALKSDPEAYQALLNSLHTEYPDTLSEGINYLLVVTTSGLGIEEVICCAKEREHLMADANTLNALCNDFLPNSFYILKILLAKTADLSDNSPLP